MKYLNFYYEAILTIELDASTETDIAQIRQILSTIRDSGIKAIGAKLTFKNNIEGSLDDEEETFSGVAYINLQVISAHPLSITLTSLLTKGLISLTNYRTRSIQAAETSVLREFAIMSELQFRKLDSMLDDQLGIIQEED